MINLFTRNLPIIRKAKGLKQEYVAAKCGVARSTISLWENGESSPNVDSLVRLADVLEVTPDELIFGPEQITQEVEDMMEQAQEEYVNSREYKEDHFIQLISEPGQYFLEDYYINQFVGVIELDSAEIMALGLEMHRRGYDVIELYRNGFMLDIHTREEASNLCGTLFDIVDRYFIHGNFMEPSEVTSDRERLEKVMVDAYEKNTRYCNEILFGPDMKYYWTDEQWAIRGRGKTEEECRTQAAKAGVETYKICPMYED